MIFQWPIGQEMSYFVELLGHLRQDHWETFLREYGHLLSVNAKLGHKIAKTCKSYYYHWKYNFETLAIVHNNVHKGIVYMIISSTILLNYLTWLTNYPPYIERTLRWLVRVSRISTLIDHLPFGYCSVARMGSCSSLAAPTRRLLTSTIWGKKATVLLKMADFWLTEWLIR